MTFDHVLASGYDDIYLEKIYLLLVVIDVEGASWVDRSPTAGAAAAAGWVEGGGGVNIN